MRVKWSEWKGPDAQTPVLLVKHLVMRWGWQLDLHKFIAADRPGCFHTHPSRCARLILRGGYIEEVMAEDGTRTKRTIRAGHFEVFPPSYCHRVDELLDPAVGSWSIWWEGRKTQTVRLLGEGWPPEIRGRSDAEHLARERERMAATRN